MALAQVVAGARIVISDLNAYYSLLKGVTGEAITLIYNAAGVIKLQPSSDPAASTELIIVNNNAGTRQFAITAGGDLVGTGGILTLPAGADTLVGRATTDTLTNKTLTAPVIADFTNAAHDHGDADDGGVLVAAAISGLTGVTTYVRKTSDESVQSDTLQNDDELLIAVGASEVCAFDMLLRLSFTGDSGFKFTFTVPASGTGHWVGQILQESNGSTFGTGDIGLIFGHVTITNTATLAAASLGTGVYLLWLKGIYVGGGTAGNIQFQWAQASTVASNTTVKAQSFISKQVIA